MRLPSYEAIRTILGPFVLAAGLHSASEADSLGREGVAGTAFHAQTYSIGQGNASSAVAKRGTRTTVTRASAGGTGCALGNELVYHPFFDAWRSALDLADEPDIDPDCLEEGRQLVRELERGAAGVELTVEREPVLTCTGACDVALEWRSSNDRRPWLYVTAVYSGETWRITGNTRLGPIHRVGLDTSTVARELLRLASAA